MKLLSVQVGKPRTFGILDAADPHDRQWTTGFSKETASGPVALTKLNLAGDGQADLKHHGGLDKAVCVYPRDHWTYWKAELGTDMPHGGFGENFTTSGAIETDVCIGDIFRCGTALLQLSQPRQPCWKLARHWRIKDLAAKVERTGRTGWYFRVLEEGTVETGNALQILERPHAEWTVAAANAVMHHRKTDWEAAAQLANCPVLSQSWKTTLAQRAETRVIADVMTRLAGP
ncbi:MAG: MOSC domain-containing protein [Chthoniobacteraceae bacterium]